MIVFLHLEPRKAKKQMPTRGAEEGYSNREKPRKTELLHTQKPRISLSKSSSKPRQTTSKGEKKRERFILKPRNRNRRRKLLSGKCCSRPAGQKMTKKNDLCTARQFITFVLCKSLQISPSIPLFFLSLPLRRIMERARSTPGIQNTRKTGGRIAQTEKLQICLSEHF